MAYSSVRVQFEIGHEASVRTKKTPEGFTHDWEVFVRGADSTDIQCFVDKVVFYLHETFPKPRRVIKEPPYVVKESGYAGFVLPIDVYLKNKEEPKKISFQYDLTLQPSGPPISRVLREPRLFQNPSEDFRRKLIRGGGVGVDTPSEVQSEDGKSSFSVGANKIKLTESSVKKHKSDAPPNDSFAQLFGTPIRRVPESKKLAELDKKSADADLSKDRKKPSKHGPYNDKDATREKDKYIEKDKNKDRDNKNKEKPKRPVSPPFQQVLKLKEDHRRHEEKEKKKEDFDDKRQRKDDKEKREKTKDIKDVDKQLQKDHIKKERRDLKDGDYLKKLNLSKPHDGKLNVEKHRSESVEKDRPEKEKHKHRHKKKEKEKNRDKEKHKKDKEKVDKGSRERDKEKEKNDKKRYEEGKDKDEKFKRKSKSLSPGQERLKKGPLNALLDELGSSDSASPLSEDDSIPSFKSLSKPSSKIVPEIKNQNAVNVSPKLKSTNSNAPIDTSVEKETEKIFKNDENSPLKNKKEKSLNRKVRKLEKDFEKRREKEEVRARSVSSERDREDEDFEKEKAMKEDRERCEKERREEEKMKFNKDKESRKRRREKSEEKHVRTKKVGNVENNVSVSQRTGTGTADLSDGPEECRRPDKFTKEYVAQLKDLQHKIMSLEDNSELQKVVKVIAETGQYEITKKTFDFDLCALDFDTVKRLQEFFAPT